MNSTKLKTTTSKCIIVGVATPEQMSESMRIRKEVFIDEQGYDPSIELDSEDAECSHFLAILPSGEFAGTIRVVDASGKLGRLAVRKAHRGLGVGRPLCEAVRDHIRVLGGKEVWCESQADKGKDADYRAFYARQGYMPRGETFKKHGVEHQVMVLHLAPIKGQ